MPICESFTSVYSKDWEINFMQCTPNGDIKYTDFCNLMQLTAAKHSELGGISFTDMQEFNQAWVLSKMRIEIIKMPKWRDTITIKTWINSLENSRSVRSLEVYLNGEKILGSETLWIVLNTNKRRPESLMLPFSHFEFYLNKRGTGTSFNDVNILEEKHKLTEKTIVLSDLDIVNHVNNIKYLEWCLDLLPIELTLNNKIESFNMNYIRELSINDRVLIYKSHDKNKTIFSITKNNKISFALEINWK